MIARTLAIIVLAILSSGCGPARTVAAPPLPSGIPTCAPTDQDRFVYRPARLEAVLPCVRVAGTIVSSTAEADGDFHINVRVDPGYEWVLNDANRDEDGYLVVEPVCRFPPLQAEAIRVCASDTCEWVFYDTSRTGRRRWCDMATCGNRAKAARHRARTKGASKAEASAEPTPAPPA